MAVTRQCNVCISTATGDTFLGPLNVVNIKVASGANAGTVSLSVNGNTIYSQAVAANASPQSDYCEIKVTQGQTLTVTTTATGITTYIYLE